MNKTIAVIFIIIFSALCSSICFIENTPVAITAQKLKRQQEKIVPIKDSNKNMQAFLDKIGYLESGGDYCAENSFGFVGKYQFGRSAINSVGMGDVSKEEFLNSPGLQEKAERILLKNNRKFFLKYIIKYRNKTIGGVYITESGILYAAQMSPKGIIDFLKSNGEIIFKDGNGVPITKCLKELSGYNLEF